MKRNLFLKTKLVLVAALIFVGAAQLKAETITDVSTYSELLLAVNNVQSGDVIRLAADTTATESDIDANEDGIYISSGATKELTLDLNGHVLKGYSKNKAYSCIYVTGDYNVTITGTEGSKIIGDVSKESNAAAIGIGDDEDGNCAITLMGDVDIEGFYAISYISNKTGNNASKLKVNTDETYTGVVTGSGDYCVNIADNSNFYSRGGDFTHTDKNKYAFNFDGSNLYSSKIVLAGGKYNKGKDGLTNNGLAPFVIIGGTFTSECEDEVIVYENLPTGSCNLKDAEGNISIVNEKDVNYFAYYTTGTFSKDWNNTFESAKYLLVGNTLNITDGTFADGIKNFYSFGAPNNTEGITINYTRDYNGHWQAWYMPFDLDASAYSDNLIFYEITNIAIVDGSWTVKVSPVTSLKANTPYLVQSKTALKNFTITVDNVTLKKTTTEPLSFTASNGSIFKFTGTFTKKFTEKETNWYGIAQNGTFSLQTTGSSSRYLSPFRIFLEVSGDNSSKSNAFAIATDDDITGINSAEINGGNKTEVIYDLQGRQVANATKGLYIINGKKVLVK